MIGATHEVNPVGVFPAFIPVAPAHDTHPLIAPLTNLIGAYPVWQLYPQVSVFGLVTKPEQIAINVG